MDGEYNINFATEEGKLVETAVRRLDLRTREKGIVLGRGDKDRDLLRRGFETLDIDPTCHPTIVGDANKLVEHIPPNRFDVVKVERISFYNPQQNYGVQPENLAKGCFAILKPGGYLVIYTAEHLLAVTNNSDGSIPLLENMKELLGLSGFIDVACAKTTVQEYPLDPKPTGDKVLFSEAIFESLAIVTARKPTSPEVPKA